MRPQFHRIRRLLGALSVAALCLASSGCTAVNLNSLTNPDELLPFADDTPVATPTSSDRTLVYESPGVLAVFHGTTCAQSNVSGMEEGMRVQEQLDLPKGLNTATVLLNGYRVRYLDADHHVGGLGAAIGAIQLSGPLLTWEAGGFLTDNDFNDGYEWCYTFTVVAWNTLQINAVVDHGDMGHGFRDMDWTSGTPLQPVPGFLRNPAFAGFEEVAILPRGFTAAWTPDHHVLQFAYRNDVGDLFVEGGKTYGNGSVPEPESRAGSGYVSWESIGFLKDNDAEHGQFFAEIVTGLGGPDVGLIAPPFNVVPSEDSLFCGSLGSGPLTDERVVHDVPYQFAVPVLAGWDLAYHCSDQHVKEIGASIPKWEWQPGTSPAGGTLRYSVTTSLLDKDDLPGFSSRTQIKILGFRRVMNGAPTGNTGGR